MTNAGIVAVLPQQQMGQNQQAPQQAPQAGMGDIAKVQEELRGLPANDPRTMQILTSYANGANPMVPQFLALGEIKRRQAMQQQPPQPPQGTVKDKVEQAAGVMALQQAKQQQAMQAMASQAMQAPGPVPQGIPQSTVNMADGGVVALPVRDEMFNYAGGGIVAFAGGDKKQVTGDPSKQPESGMEQASQYLLSQIKADELPAYKSRDALLAEAAKTRPEILANPEEGMRKLLAQLGKTQEETRARAEQGESRQSLADLSVALNQAANATRGRKGSGLPEALGGFGAGYAPAVSAANQRQASRDALMLEQQTTQAKMQYELQEKERARAVGDVDKEMVHAQNYAALKDKYVDNKRDAAKSYLSDERTRAENELNRKNQLAVAGIQASRAGGGTEGLRLKYLDQQQDSLVAELNKISPFLKEQRAPLEAKLAIVRKELAKLTGIDTIGGNAPPAGGPSGASAGGNNPLYSQADAILNRKK
jgi:hypothetical protein